MELSRCSLLMSSAVALIAFFMAAAVWQVTPYRLVLLSSLDANDPHALFGNPQQASPYIQTHVTSPVLSHPWILPVVARLLTCSPLGDVLSRWLLDTNGVTGLIELAAAMQQADPTSGTTNKAFVSGKELGLGEPVLIRLSETEHAWHVAQAQLLTTTTTTTTITTDKSIPFPRFASTTTEHNKDRRRYRTVRDYHAAYLAQQTTPTAVLERLLQFVHDTNATLRCIQQVNTAAATTAAAAATRRFANHHKDNDDNDDAPLSLWDGVPVMIKSEIDVAGFVTTNGQPWAAGVMVDDDPSQQQQQQEDVIVQRLRAAGAVIVATTVMHEKGVQPTGYNAHYGGPHNPYDTARFSGGSSSGSAVAVATGMCPMAIGFDGGGSVRIPAAWSGVTGLAVGYGRIPWYGSRVNMFTVTKAGSLAATVQDAADALWLLGQPLTEQEGRNHHIYHVKYGGGANGVPPPHWTPRWENSTTTTLEENDDHRPVVKIGVFRDWVSHRATGTGQGADDAVYKTYEKTLQRLVKQSKGIKYEIVEFTIPHMREQALAHGLLITSLFSFSMVKELYKETSSRHVKGGPLMFQPATQIQIKLGQQLSALELLACMRLQAFAVAQWRAVMSSSLGDETKAHVILTPTTPMTALRRPPGSDVFGFTDTALFLQMMRFIWPGNLAGLPGLAVPVGVDSLGLPVSVQVICTHWHEADCLAVGADIEALFAEERPTPPAHLFFDPLSET